VCHAPYVLGRPTYLDCLARDIGAFADLLRTGDLAVPVPDCPGWSLADLGAHLGGVHRWAHDIVRTGSPAEQPDGPRERAALVAWFTEGGGQLLDALTSTDPDATTWTFGPHPRQVSFWVRRQAQETAMHLLDARRAVGESAAFDPELAPDGVDEVVEMFVPRQVRLGRIAPIRDGVLLRTGDGRVWQLGSDPAVPAVATVTGTAEQVLLALWRREDWTSLRVDGDIEAARSAFSVALTP